MPIPWLAILDTVAGLSNLARRATRPPPPADDPLSLTTAGPGTLETRLAGVVVAALKEAFDRDARRLDLERDQLEAERLRAERALRLELVRQAGDREVARQRLVAGVAVVSLLATLVVSTLWLQGATAGRVALGLGWLLLLGALSTAFAAQSQVGRALARLDDRAAAADGVTPGLAGQAAPWLMIAGLAVLAAGVLFG